MFFEARHYTNWHNGCENITTVILQYCFLFRDNLNALRVSDEVHV